MTPKTCRRWRFFFSFHHEGEAQVCNEPHIHRARSALELVLLISESRVLALGPTTRERANSTLSHFILFFCMCVCVFFLCNTRFFALLDTRCVCSNCKLKFHGFCIIRFLHNWRFAYCLRWIVCIVKWIYCLYIERKMNLVISRMTIDYNVVDCARSFSPLLLYSMTLCSYTKHRFVKKKHDVPSGSTVYYNVGNGNWVGVYCVWLMYDFDTQPFFDWCSV